MVAPLAVSGKLCVPLKSLLPSACLVSSAIVKRASDAINIGPYLVASFSTRLPHKLFCLLFSTSVLECLTYAVLRSISLIFLDAYQGPLQWQTSYNLVALRHISFAVDKHWSSNQLAVWEPVRAQHDTLKVRCIETEDPYYSNCLFCQRQVCCESTCMHAHAKWTCTLSALCRGYIAVCMYWECCS